MTAVAIGARTAASAAFFEPEADRIARLCHRMAERFARGGRLIAFGWTPAARSDVRHVAVEFVHPVIVGKRALPALGLTREGGELEAQVDLEAEPGDIALALDDSPEAQAALRLAGGRGCLTIACPGDFSPPGGADVRQELTETLYHVLWELVHVFFDHRGLLEGRSSQPAPRRRSVELPLPVPRRAGARSRVRGGGRPGVRGHEGGRERGAARADAEPRAPAPWPRRRASCGGGSTRAGGCWRWATAGRRPTRWTWSPTSAAARRRCERST